MSLIKQRPDINFVPPYVDTFALTPEQKALHDERTEEMVFYNDHGYSWVDAHLLAFGTGTITPYQNYIQFDGNAICELIGRTVVTEEDYLDLIYAYIAQEEATQQVIEQLPEEEPKRGRPRLDTEQAREKAAARKAIADANHAYLQACRDRKAKLAALWEDYQHKQEMRKQAEAKHKALCEEAYTLYIQCRSVVPQRNDFK